jgi:phosphoglycerol transferase MdoB-like AlkP superfamily enzyme
LHSSSYYAKKKSGDDRAIDARAADRKYRILHDKFRGRVVLPTDLNAIRTVANVTGSYDFTPEGQQWIAIGIFVVMISLLILAFKFRREQDQVHLTVPKVIVGISIPIICIILFFGTSMLTALGFQESLWKTMWVTGDNGIVLNYVVNLKYSNISKPGNYSAALVDRLAAERSDSAQDAAFRPNVIVIMNEAFSDLSVIGIETSEDYLPFYHSMKEDSIKGDLHVSVMGGHTASSEYELLTGNTMAFMPEYTVPYQLHVRENDYSIVNQFNTLGYQTIAMHPYYASGWNRVAVYNHFGFDEMYFIEDFESPEYIREYISDASNYENLIRVFEEKKEDGPLFVFNITMQNHGYYDDKDVFEDPIIIENTEVDDSGELIVNLYRESDRAFEDLITYFRNVDEPTVIVLFGDHQPPLNAEFYAELFSEDNDEFPNNVYESLYVVPYVIWANYDIQEEQDVDMSLNYLSAYLMEKLGLPMTGYGKFLLATREILPFINGPFVSETGVEFLKDKTLLSDEAREALYNYEVIQYCAVVDRKNRPEEFFNLSE